MVRSVAETLRDRPLIGGLGNGELPADSASERLRRAARGHVTTAVAEADLAATAPAAVRDQLTHAASRVLALA